MTTKRDPAHGTHPERRMSEPEYDLVEGILHLAKLVLVVLGVVFLAVLLVAGS